MKQIRRNWWAYVGLLLVLAGGSRIAYARYDMGGGAGCFGTVHLKQAVGLPPGAPWVATGLTCAGPCPPVGGVQGNCLPFVFNTLPNGDKQLTCGCIYNIPGGGGAFVVVFDTAAGGGQPYCDGQMTFDFTVQPPNPKGGGCAGACPPGEACEESTTIEYEEGAVSWKLASCACF